MPSVDSVLKTTQPGLMLMPTHGLFLTGWLADPSDSGPVLKALRTLVSRADHGNGGRRGVLAGVAGEVWARWTGKAPPGGPDGGSILSNSPHFRSTGGDLWLYLKAESNAGVDALLQAVDDTVGPLLSRRDETRAALPPDGKILDQHFFDGFTSPGDPASVVDRVLQTGTDTSPGACWAITQKFDIAWTAFRDMSVDEQQNVIGRTDDGVLIPDRDVLSHVKRMRAVAQDQSNLELVRQALPFGPMSNSGGRERGIYFAGMARDTHTFERLLQRMVGGRDKLLGIVRAVAGGYFYVPSAQELGLHRGLTLDDFHVPAFWRERSGNGLMFYNSADYLNVMSTGRYGPGDPPTQRILGLMSKMFSRWQNKWYRPFDIPRMQPLAHYVAPDDPVLAAPVPVRKGMSVRVMLTEVCTTTAYPVPRDSWCWRADVFRIDPDDLLVGVMPELSLGRGKEVMPYLTDQERLAGWLESLDETSSMGHVVPDHPKLLRMGLGGVLDEVRAGLERVDGELGRPDLPADRKAALTDQQTFYRSSILALEGMQGYCRNYALLAERMAADHGAHPEQQRNLQGLAERMRKLATEKPDTFVEAAQCIFNLHCCLHQAGEPVSVGRLDQLLWPYWKTTTEEEAQEVLDAFWVKLGEKALHNRQNATDHVTYGTTTVSYIGGNFPQGDGINQWVQQVTIGGWLPDDAPKPTPGANRLTLLCLRSARRLPLNAPVLSIRLYPGIGDDIVREAAMALASGGSHPILFHEERMVRALHEFSGLPLDAARDYVCDGCYEPMVAGQCEFAFSNVMTLDALECALNQGARFNLNGPVYLRGWKLSFRSPHAAQITTFEQLQQIYLQHLRWFTVQFFTGVLGNYGNLWSYCPSPLLSPFVQGCVESGRDLTNGGTRYHLIAPMFLACSLTIDSLYAVKKLVFDPETAVCTLPELVQALHCNWGHDMIEPFQSTLAGELRGEERAKRFRQIRARALQLPKFGMGVPEVDEVGRWLVENMADIARDTLNDPPPPLASILQAKEQAYSTPDHPWKLTLQVGVGTFEAYVGDALDSNASPNGRLSGQPYPSDFSPTPIPQDMPPVAQDPGAPNPVAGANRPIYTGMSSWNQEAVYHNVSNAAPVDLNVREDFPVQELEELIRQYVAGNVGSNLFTVTVADPDTYHMAARQPERYELVRVRMGGWTEYFAAMFPAHHDQHLRRPYFVPEEPPAGRIG
ncbi:MAG TPA: Dyp-type peroxidase [Longimicrobium sp.]|nr:Dyp-type peroxidase [Longimicrobium sp.]